MKPIEGSIFAPFLQKYRKIIFKPPLKFSSSFEFITEEYWVKNGATVYKIRSSEGYPVKSFRQLVEEVAIVTINNKNYEMFYRGQNNDYQDCQSEYHREKTKKTIIYPTICRPEIKSDGKYKYSIKKERINERYNNLYKMIELLPKKRRNLDEFYFSLFQHYGILPTPLIDLTQSLRVAATFALRNSETGYLYVLGLPYPNGSISHFIDLEIVLVKLQNICPVNALRPRYQEGYLVGKYPFQFTKEAGDNLARRMVAKYRLDNTDGNFWDKNFSPMPEDVLFPEKDEYKEYLEKVKKTFIKK